MAKRKLWGVDRPDHPAIGVLAAVLDDIESARKANNNRIGILVRGGADKDGIVRGSGLDEDDPMIEGLRYVNQFLEDAEQVAIKNLEGAMKEHPLAPWAKQAKGVGLKQLARLIAVIGDPYMNTSTGQPRTVASLWKYCGLDVREGAAPRLKRGVKSNWSTRAKTRAFLIAESCMKQRCKYCSSKAKGSDLDHGNVENPADHVQVGSTSAALNTNEDQPDYGCTCPKYRRVYDVRKNHARGTHPDWTDVHRNLDALRKVSKEVLKDLWIASRDWHLKHGGDDAAGGIREPGTSGQ